MKNPESIVRLQRALNYPEKPYSPGVKYLEYPFTDISQGENQVYSGMRNLLRISGLDKENYNKRGWNPMREFVGPGAKIFINPGGAFVDSLSHPSLLKVILDYIYIATEGKAEIFVGFSPFDWETEEEFKLPEPGGKDFRVRWIDLREANGGDSLGYTQIDLGEASEFYKYRGNWKLMSMDGEVDTHKPHIARYFISTTVLSSDLIINIARPALNPWLGVSGILASALGFIGNPERIPLFSKGAALSGGDQCPGEEKKECKKTMGKWWGNDTLWRAVLDINKIILYFNYDGSIRHEKRKILSFLDGISISGKKAGFLAAGLSQGILDCVSLKLMGYDWKKIPLILNFFTISSFPLSQFSPKDISVIAEDIFLSGKFDEIEPVISLGEMRSWKGKLR